MPVTACQHNVGYSTLTSASCWLQHSYLRIMLATALLPPHHVEGVEGPIEVLVVGVWEVVSDRFGRPGNITL